MWRKKLYTLTMELSENLCFYLKNISPTTTTTVKLNLLDKIIERIVTSSPFLIAYFSHFCPFIFKGLVSKSPCQISKTGEAIAKGVGTISYTIVQWNDAKYPGI